MFQAGLVVLQTGMGFKNAEEAGRQALLRWKPGWLVTAGFAGGLSDRWPRGSLIMDADPGFPWVDTFIAAGFRPGRFTCQNQIAVTPEAKAQLAAQTGADAVEMESEILRRLSGENGIPSATARVISDDWRESLPLDFNQLADEHQRLHVGKLALNLARQPGKIPELIGFGRQIQAAAKILAEALRTAVEGSLRHD